ncbi:hypothetical protein TVAG_493120 [Trichomonas vaginalis G3]|uniref:Uncharacterized protein n=1 Tax=Trichomonas vaginalis (strain ATCC PRA-98 / G3) TaxID=412133 RepID=A2F2C0_TRIV3|nr:hypothetical protein TVAGG3_0232760 [Trichomonas vaginalis G3]EAY00939.1 hypothetical protein TVAG_493120 [Trichomonas vaginalis G3]KAI5552768.1 hypothetical protein TVAGG3_0232760 [Trichomonas vaginalis G3]|eukprot:XP_001313868.1 hypothetical protein [Trichomonas vaginalis G3]
MSSSDIDSNDDSQVDLLKTSKDDNCPKFEDCFSKFSDKSDFPNPHNGSIVYTSLEYALVSVILDNKKENKGIPIEILKSKSLGIWYMNLNSECSQITDTTVNVELAKNSFGKFNFIRIEDDLVVTDITQVPSHFKYIYSKKNNKTLSHFLNKVIKTIPSLEENSASSFYTHLTGQRVCWSLQLNIFLKKIQSNFINYSLEKLGKYVVEDAMMVKTERKTLRYKKEEEQLLYEYLYEYNYLAPMYYVDLMNFAHYCDLFLEITDENEFLKRFLKIENTFKKDSYVGFKIDFDKKLLDVSEIENPYLDQKILQFYKKSGSPEFLLENIQNRVSEDDLTTILQSPASFYYSDTETYAIIPDYAFIANYRCLYLQDYINKVTSLMIKQNNYDFEKLDMESLDDTIIPTDTDQFQKVSDIDKSLIRELLTGKPNPELETNSLPSKIDYSNVKKLTKQDILDFFSKKQNEVITILDDEPLLKISISNKRSTSTPKKKKSQKKGKKELAAEMQDSQEPPRRKRGRPRKHPLVTPDQSKNDDVVLIQEIKSSSKPKTSFKPNKTARIVSDRSYSFMEDEDDEIPKSKSSNAILPKILPKFSDYDDEEESISEYDLIDWEEPTLISKLKECEPGVIFNKLPKVSLDIDANPRPEDMNFYTNSNPIPPLRIAIQDLVKSNSFSIDLAIERLWPVYGAKFSGVDSFIEQIWYHLGELDACVN